MAVASRHALVIVLRDRSLECPHRAQHFESKAATPPWTTVRPRQQARRARFAVGAAMVDDTNV
jgi:hypothetical protein